MATEEITISELELADEVLADMTLPVDTATETRAVTLKQLRAWLGSALPVGSVFASVGRLDDERFTLLDGKIISRIGTYEAFCNKVVEKVQAGTWKACTEEEFNLEVSETGQCGKFVVSNDYVRIPKLGNSLCSGVIDGKIPVVGNGMTLGFTDGTNNAGTVFNSQSNIQTAGGAYGKNVGTLTTGETGLTGNSNIGITTDPTKSGIEGKINSVEVFYYMVISTEGQTASVEIDINQVYEDMNLKANSDLSNVASVSSGFKEQSVGWGMPDYTTGVQVMTSAIGQREFIAEFDCLFQVRFVGAGHCHWRVNDGNGPDQLCGSNGTNYTQIPIYLSKGTKLTGLGSVGDWNVYVYPLKGVN